MVGIGFVKGHGTQNDFVVLPDAGNALDLTAARVRALCDRQRGLGADGVLRVVRASAAGLEGTTADWFMDYRNADGSVAEMCGNGVRVFARYLVEAGLVDSREFPVATRAGDRQVRVHDDMSVTVHMGTVRVTGSSSAKIGGVEVRGLAVDVGNPHLVCLVDADVDTFDLRDQPWYDEADFPDGVNVELVNRADGALRMRVHERGVGETRACGTGTVAVTAADLHLLGESEGSRAVHMPGGRVEVRVAGGEATMTGPAEFVASGEIADAWWAAQR
ncbi:MAG: diaminopimelate epimerase [Thermocrispum agreste]|uniref:Diaminopimelate epimerase n=1 Tax=Thermocrispum agreste TaxID=37925 RepID=A0A2W4LP08_9PSEU|nr:MAG: diaminopimelate epimerase [Thermocrispum agreste]